MDKISREYLQLMFVYDESTGTLYNRVKRGNRTIVGGRVGTKHELGHLQVRVCGRLYRVAKIIWYMQTGQWPAQVRHKSRNLEDNRMENLKAVE